MATRAFEVKIKDADINAIRKTFKNNEPMFFYGRIPHCVVNELSTPRYVIVLDHDIDKDYLVDISEQ